MRSGVINTEFKLVIAVKYEEYKELAFSTSLILYSKCFI